MSNEAKGIVISYEEDCLGMDDSDAAKAKMPCGHVISVDSMTMFLRSLLENKKITITCPSNKPDGSACNTPWPYKLCKKVGILT